MSNNQNNRDKFEQTAREDKVKINSEWGIDPVMKNRHKRGALVRDLVEFKLDEDEQAQYFDTYNQVRALGSEAEAAFTIGLAPQLSPATPDQEIDHLELSNYLRCWEILTAWVNQVVPGRSGQLDYIVRQLPILSSRDNPKE